MADVQTHTFSLDGLGVYSICVRLLYSANIGPEVVCDVLEQAWVLSLWEAATQCRTIWPAGDIRGAMATIAASNANARRRACDSMPAGFTGYTHDLDVVRRTYYQDIRVTLVGHLRNVGFSQEDGSIVISKLDAVSNNVSLGLAVTDDIVRGAAVSGSTIMEMVHKSNETVYPHTAGVPVEGYDEDQLDKDSDLAPWLRALNRIKYYQDKRMTLDEFLGDFAFRESSTLFQTRENAEGLPQLFQDESYSRIFGSELLVFESSRWASFKFRGSVLNFQKTNRAVSSRMGTDIEPRAVQTALLLGSRECVLSIMRIKDALKRLVTRRENEIERMYQLILEKDDHYNGKEEDIKKEIMSGVRIKRIGDRLGITYCDTTQRIGAAIRNARISGVKFNAKILEADIELERPREEHVESLTPDVIYSEFQTASELDAWFESILATRGVLGDRKNLRYMLRARVEKLIATNFKMVHVSGPKGCWSRLYRLSNGLEEKVAEYFADLPHMIAANTTLLAGPDGMTQRGFVLARSSAKMWHVKGSSVEPGVPVTGRIELKKGDFLALEDGEVEEDAKKDRFELSKRASLSRRRA